MREVSVGEDTGEVALLSQADGSKFKDTVGTLQLLSFEDEESGQLTCPLGSHNW